MSNLKDKFYLFISMFIAPVFQSKSFNEIVVPLEKNKLTHWNVYINVYMFINLILIVMIFMTSDSLKELS